MFDGTKVLVPIDFNTKIEERTGDLLAYPEGDTSVPASGRMPAGGHFLVQSFGSLRSTRPRLILPITVRNSGFSPKRTSISIVT